VVLLEDETKSFFVSLARAGDQVPSGPSHSRTVRTQIIGRHETRCRPFLSHNLFSVTIY
jgi:hypothetical protein